MRTCCCFLWLQTNRVRIRTARFYWNLPMCKLFGFSNIELFIYVRIGLVLVEYINSANMIAAVIHNAGLYDDWLLVKTMFMARPLLFYLLYKQICMNASDRFWPFQSLWSTYFISDAMIHHLWIKIKAILITASIHNATLKNKSWKWCNSPQYIKILIKYSCIPFGTRSYKA